MTVEKPKPNQTKAVIPTNHIKNKQHYEPITISSNDLPLAQSAGKITRVRGAIGFGLLLIG